MMKDEGDSDSDPECDECSGDIYLQHVKTDKTGQQATGKKSWKVWEVMERGLENLDDIDRTKVVVDSDISQ